MGRPRALGILLAGGGSTRFGGPKAAAPWKNQRLADRATTLLAAVCPRVGVVSGAHAQVPGWPAPAGLEVRGDLVPGQGPLGGIVTGLTWAQEVEMDGILVLPVDMPEVPAILLDLILEEAASGWDVVVPESEGPRGFEPLCAWYSCDSLGALHERLRDGVRAPAEAIEGLEVVRIPLPEVRKVTDPAMAFHNINRPQDLGRAFEEETP